MTGAQLLDAQVQEKRRYALLSELFDLTKQLAEAVDRNDEVTIQMLLSMREGPLAQMRQVEENLTRQRSSLSEEDGRRLAALRCAGPAAGGKRSERAGGDQPPLTRSACGAGQARQQKGDTREVGLPIRNMGALLAERTHAKPFIFPPAARSPIAARRCSDWRTAHQG